MQAERDTLPAAEGAPAIPECEITYPNVTDGAALTRDQVFVGDAVVVGTGAGGATAAARLREAGLDVLMLEEGTLHRTESFTPDVQTMIRLLYREAGASTILGRPPMAFAEGKCVGGSTVIGGGVCVRCPDRVLEHWERALGLEGLGPQGMEPYFVEAERILQVQPNDDDTLGRNAHLFVDGARRLGWSVEPTRRNTDRCVGLNNCVLGCPTGAKRAMHVTEIPRALAMGASLVTRAQVDRVLFLGTRAVGVRGKLLGEDGLPCCRFQAHAPLVVLAAGARETPGILKRSRLRARMIGRGLHTQPSARVVGVMAERVDPWVGAHQAFEIHEFLDQGILIGYSALPPGVLASALPGIGEDHGEKMRDYNYMLNATALIQDQGEGRVIVGLDRQARMIFKLGKRDLQKIHRGVALAAELLFAAGARRVFTPFADLPVLDSAEELARMTQHPPAAAKIALSTVHIMSTARMAKRPRRGVTDNRGAVHGVDGLVVADASVLPSSMGVNPQETIVAMALRNADRWIDLVGGRRRRGVVLA